MKTLKDLLEHQLKDLYSAELQIVDALPVMIKEASDSKLKNALQNHFEETKNHRDRLEEVCNELGIEPSGETCKAMKGLIREAEDFLNEDTAEDVKNAGIIAQAQRVEHYEIAGYGTAVRYAKELNLDSIVNKLQKTLDEEYGADDSLTDIAEAKINDKAKS